MSTTDTSAEPTRITETTSVFRVYIKATPQAIWDAITKPEWTEKYAYRARNEYDLRPGGAFRALSNEGMLAVGAPEVAIDGEVVESDPPNRLVHTYRFNFAPEQTAEGFTTLTWEITPEDNGISQLTVIHDVTGAPLMADAIKGRGPLAEGGGGWAWVLSDLKSLLESGRSMQD